MWTRILLGVLKIFQIDCGDGCTTLKMLNTIALDTFNGCIGLYVNYVPIKLFLKR